MPTDRLQAHRPDVPDMSADLIAGRRFGQSWRGYDPEEVQQFLGQVAAQVRALRERLETEGAARRDAEQRASHPQIDEATLMTAVGDETAGILRSARSAAAEITAKAQAGADAVMAEAQAKATEIGAQAQELLESRTAQAEAQATDMRLTAIAEADGLRTSAQRDAEALAQEAAEKYQETVEAAQAVRERILTDLARRRKLGSVQIEQLRAGRERLLDAYLLVRRTLDDVTNELQRADAEARAAADAVGRQNGADHAGDLVDLRGDEGWDALNAFSDRKMPTGPKPGADGPQGPEPGANGERGAGVPASVASAVLAGPAGATPSLGGASAVSPTITLVPASTRVASGPAPANGTTAVISRSDAIESVRILPREARPAPGTSTLPSSPPDGAPLPDVVVSTDAAVGGAAVDGASAEAGIAAAGATDVDDLFARIRAGRQDATATARQTLAGAPESQADVGLTSVTAAGSAPSVDPPAAGPGTDGTQANAALASPIGAGQAEANGDNALLSVTAATVVAPTGTGEPTTMVSPQGLQVSAAHLLLGRRDEVVAHLESSLARKLKRALQDEQNSLLDRLRSAKSPATALAVLPSAEEHPDRFVEAGRPLLAEAARAGAKLAVELNGKGSVAAVKPNSVEDLAEELGKSIAEPLRRRLELAFASGTEETSELADAVGAAYREWKTQRIEAAARDQVTAAFSRGSYLALPTGTRLRWLSSPSEGPCPDCEDNALAGEQPKGDKWPTGQLYPPAHPGCRCALEPVPAVSPA